VAVRLRLSSPLSLCRYYETDLALSTHRKSKVHRRRLKELKTPAYTIEESERAVGMGRDNGKDRINAEINAQVGNKAGEPSDAKMATDA
jgi:bud site selection protein 20